MKSQEVAAILIVDDEPATLEAMANILGRAGFITACATSGAGALQRLKERRFACMITVLNMQFMDGFELALKAYSMSPDMLIALCTGDGSPTIRKDAAAAGIGIVFHKRSISGRF